MSIERRYFQPFGFVLTLLRGRVNGPCVFRHLGEKAVETRGMQLTAELIDCRDLTDVSGLESRDIHAAAQYERDETNQNMGKLAILVPNDLIFGLARIYQSVSEPCRRDIEIFRTIEESLAWLELSNLHGEIEALKLAAATERQTEFQPAEG